MQIKVKQLEEYNGHGLRANGSVDLNLKAKYSSTITLYGGSSASGANPKITLGESITDGGTASNTIFFIFFDLNCCAIIFEIAETNSYVNSFTTSTDLYFRIPF